MISFLGFSSSYDAHLRVYTHRLYAIALPKGGSVADAAASRMEPLFAQRQ